MFIKHEGLLAFVVVTGSGLEPVVFEIDRATKCTFRRVS
jgi:hypothetical protein